MARILLSAYACEPGKGSEPGLGWMWATGLAALRHDVWVITRAANQPAIEADATSVHFHGLQFVYCDLPGWARRWKRLPGGTSVYYFLWQWLAFCTARRLNRAQRFDCVHHVTFVSLRAPSFMGLLGIPFYFGPVSGGECIPRRLRRDMSLRARAFEWLRDAANLMVRIDPLTRMAIRQADRVYLTSWESLILIPARHRFKCEVTLAIGMTSEQLGLSARASNRFGPKLRCLYVGRLLEWKGVDIALRAMQRLKQQGVPAHLTLVGEGPAQRQLQKHADRLGINKQLAWIPWLTYAEVQRLYQEHDVFLFPSLRDSGGMVVLEALAHGLPVVCLGLGGPARIVDRRCGRVVETAGRNFDELANAIAQHVRELAQNPGLRQSLSIDARRRAWDFEFSKLIATIYCADTSAQAAATEVALA